VIRIGRHEQAMAQRYSLLGYRTCTKTPLLPALPDFS
jgi:hypothetical protein